MIEKMVRCLGRISLVLLASAAAVSCSKSSTTQVSQTPTAFAAHRYGTDGTPDATFGGGSGTVITDIDPAQIDFATAVALQTNGSIVAAGQSVMSGQGVVAVVRYSAGGALDTSFGTGGIVRTVVGSGNTAAYSIAVQPADNKILVAATTFNASTSATGFALIRYNPNGSLDTSFGAGGAVPGIVTGAIGTGTAQDTVSLALQTDTKIVVAGADSSGSFVLARFTASGTLDTSFNPTGTVPGTVRTPLGPAAGIGAMPPAIALQADGKIVAAGAVGNFSTPIVDVALVRYNTNGSLDTSFGAGGAVPGIVTKDIGNSVNYANAVAVQADQKIVVVGHVNLNFSANASDLAVLRYNTDGTLDATFGAGQGLQGFVVTDLGAFDNALSVALQADQKIVVSGNTIGTTTASVAVLRYNTDGSPDTPFGPNGNGRVIAAPIGPSNVASGNEVAVQTDGKIVAVGYD